MTMNLIKKMNKNNLPKKTKEISVDASENRKRKASKVWTPYMIQVKMSE